MTPARSDTTAAPDAATLTALSSEWSDQWPAALDLWSPFTRLRPPVLCTTPEEEQAAGLTGSFAMIRLVDQTVVVSLRQIATRGLERFPLEILGHEIGHHILCPADLADNARLLARIRRALPSVEGHAPLVANLYADLLINDRLQRRRGLDMAGMYRTLGPGDPDDTFWRFYLRTYEVLWSVPRGELCGPPPPPAPLASPSSPNRQAHAPTDATDGEPATVGSPATEMDDGRIEADAALASRLIRSYASHWLDGGGRFAALCLPYLLAHDPDGQGAWTIWADAVHAGAGGVPAGLTEVDDDEAGGAIHPAFDPALNGLGDLGRDLDLDRRGPPPSEPAEPRTGTATGSAGQYRQPFEYGELLRACGLELDPEEVAVRYYRERAARHLVPFPSVRTPSATDPLPEGTEPWDVGSPLADVDWVATVTASPVVIPGVTTLQRTWGTSSGTEPDEVPLDLDLYVDSSGSMPDPTVTVSYLTLAGAIVALSALRAGARVQVTLWSGTHQFTCTPGFTRDEQAVLRVLTGFFGGGTAFPIHKLRDTFAGRPPDGPGPGDRPAHVLIVSDDGVTTMFDPDERGADGREVTNHALRQAGGGGTMVLNLWNDLAADPQLVQAQADGWAVHVVRDWPDLVTFARAFSRTTYAGPGARLPRTSSAPSPVATASPAVAGRP